MRGSAATTGYTTNAMNDDTAVGGATHLYSDRGALKDDGKRLDLYDGHDRLVEVRTRRSGGARQGRRGRIATPTWPRYAATRPGRGLMSADMRSTTVRHTSAGSIRTASRRAAIHGSPYPRNGPPQAAKDEALKRARDHVSKIVAEVKETLEAERERLKREFREWETQAGEPGVPGYREFVGPHD